MMALVSETQHGHLKVAFENMHREPKSRVLAHIF